jgi:dTDP-4-dehydrorhamnose 3,5-epimerase
MRFLETSLAGAFVVELDRHQDERGFFARSFCTAEFAAAGLNAVFVQCNVSFNAHRGTIRGMHWQAAPHEEAKLVRCTRGSLHDVLVDLRPTSPTHRKWMAVELSAANHRQLYVPPGIAHGFQTLEPDTEVFYLMSASFHPECARGLRWDDPTLAIEWPIAGPVLSERDRAWPLLEAS